VERCLRYFAAAGRRDSREAPNPKPQHTTDVCGFSALSLELRWDLELGVWTFQLTYFRDVPCRRNIFSELPSEQ
jgi:hypothetical protein